MHWRLMETMREFFFKNFIEKLPSVLPIDSDGAVDRDVLLGSLEPVDKTDEGFIKMMLDSQIFNYYLDLHYFNGKKG